MAAGSQAFKKFGILSVVFGSYVRVIFDSWFIPMMLLWLLLFSHLWCVIDFFSVVPAEVHIQRKR
jgi:hypothetical protein